MEEGYALTLENMMDWKEKTLETLRAQAHVVPLSGSDTQFVVSVDTEDGTLRTIVRLDVKNQTIHYENGIPHILKTPSELVDSMSEHLEIA